MLYKHSYTVLCRDGDKINICTCSAQMQFSFVTVFLCLQMVKSAGAEPADAKGHPSQSLAAAVTGNLSQIA